MDNLDIQATNESQSSYIKIIGVGGAGTNAVNHMYNKKITGVDFLVCNTDKQSLDHSPVQNKIQLGKGLGAGNVPMKGKAAAEAARDVIKQALLDNTHMLFIAAGMGGGTGTGASPVIASIAKEIELQGETDEAGDRDEILVVAIVTIPFAFEGRKRREQAIAGIEELKQYVDAMIIVNTDKLKERGKMNMKASFALADDILLTAAKGVSEMMTANESYIHVDFRDVQSVMRKSGVALMGSGEGEGTDRAYKAIEAATTCDLLNNNDLSKTQNILMYITCSSDPDLEINNEEIEVITDYVQSITNADVDLIWGYGYDDSLEGKVAVTIVATGFESKAIYNPIERGNSITNPTPIETEPVISKPQIDVFNPVVNSTPQENITNEIPLVGKENSQVETNTNLSITRTIGELQADGTIIDYTQNEEQRENNQPLEPFLISAEKERFDSFEHRTLGQTQQESFSQTIVEKEVSEQKTKIHLDDIIPSTNNTDSEALHWERVQKIRNLLNTRQGVKQISEMRPVNDDMDTLFSADTQSSHTLAINKSGSLVDMENPALNGPVD